MAGKPHDMTGRKCVLCDFEFTKRNASGIISIRLKKFIVNLRVCVKCHFAHKRGELEQAISTYIQTAGF